MSENVELQFRLNLLAEAEASAKRTQVLVRETADLSKDAKTALLKQSSEQLSQIRALKDQALQAQRAGAVADEGEGETLSLGGAIKAARHKARALEGVAGSLLAGEGSQAAGSVARIGVHAALEELGPAGFAIHALIGIAEDIYRAHEEELKKQIEEKANELREELKRDRETPDERFAAHAYEEAAAELGNEAMRRLASERAPYQDGG